MKKILSILILLLIISCSKNNDNQSTIIIQEFQEIILDANKTTSTTAVESINFGVVALNQM